MKKFHSYFKDPEQDRATFFAWADALMNLTGHTFAQQWVDSELGKTLVWTYGTDRPENPVLVIFPGFRTTPLFWDLDKGLELLMPHCQLYLVETNGQPNPSDGHTPYIKSEGYGRWAADLLKKLNIEECFIAGASFGGNVCMKLCNAAPEKIKAAFLLNPGCLQPFSMSLKNLYLNLMPLFSPSRKNISKFMDGAVFHKPQHAVAPEFEKLALDYQEFAMTRYKDKTQKPYYMKEELGHVQPEVHLILGDKDILFPHAKSAANARKHLKNLKKVHLLPNIGHGIETDRRALQILADTIAGYHSSA